MNHRYIKRFWIFCFSAFLLSSCSNTRFLTNDQMLYTGRSGIDIPNRKEIKNSKDAADIVEEVSYHKLNNSLLGRRRDWLPIGLWTFNYLKPKKEGKKGSWFYKTFKEEPILIETVNPELRCKKIESSLFKIGFFHAHVTYKIRNNKRNPRKARIAYKVEIDQPFTINKILTPAPIDSIDIFINNYCENMNMKPGDVFNLERIRNEKTNIVSQLTEQGYFYLGTDNIEFIADTIEVPHKINLMIRKKPATPDFICRKYTIDKIGVNILWPQVEESNSTSINDTVYFKGVNITALNDYLKPIAIHRCIQFNSGDLYSSTKHQGTVKQLNNYGVFKYVKMQFILTDSVNKKLDLVIDLSTKDNVTLNFEGYTQTKSTGFVGPGIETRIGDGNVGKEADKIQLKLYGGFEWQWGSKLTDDLGSNSYNMGINSSFAFPRLIHPFRIPGEETLLTTRTVCDIGFEFLNNTRYYRMTSLTTGLNYQWKKIDKITNVFSPVRVNIVNILETTSKFDEIADSNIYVRKSFDEQTILGMQYVFIFDNTSRTSNGFYMQAILSTSGNVANVVSRAIGMDKPYTILGNVYSQFIKTSLDVRYLSGTANKGLVFRVYSGTGYSYGNSTVMPYVEQYYSGGSTSLRGFSARSLGPGSYKPDDSNGVIDQTGDIKLEFNLEYRFPLSEKLKGAIFGETGNVWLLNKDENRPGGEFEFNKIKDQLAVGAGLGVRYDFDFFILRGDFGFPIRNTYESEDGYWLKNMGDVLSGYRFNFAIGYPF